MRLPALHLHRQGSLISAEGTNVDIRTGRSSFLDIANHLTQQQRLLATVKMLIPKADRKLIHELVSLTTVNATPALEL